MPDKVAEKKCVEVPSDAIMLDGMHFFGYHGVNPEERALGARYDVDLVVALDLRSAAISDDLEQSISYSDLYRHVRNIVEGPPYTIIEAVAEAIAQDLLTRYDRAHAITVTVSKPFPPVRGGVIDAGRVRIRRCRLQTDD